MDSKDAIHIDESHHTCINVFEKNIKEINKSKIHFK